MARELIRNSSAPGTCVSNSTASSAAKQKTTAKPRRMFKTLRFQMISNRPTIQAEQESATSFGRLLHKCFLGCSINFANGIRPDAETLIDVDSVLVLLTGDGDEGEVRRRFVFRPDLPFQFRHLDLAGASGSTGQHSSEYHPERHSASKCCSM